MTVEKKRLRFSVEDDLCLLREVLAINPFEDSKRWSWVQDMLKEKIGKEFSIRAIKDHLELLLKKFIEKDDKNIKKTSIEEEYNEYDHLLQQIKQLRNDFLTKKTFSDPNRIRESMAKGKAIRDNSLQLFRGQNQITTQADIHEIQYADTIEGGDIITISGETEYMPMEHTIPEQKETTSHTQIEFKPMTKEPQNSKAEEKLPGLNVLAPNRRRQPKRLKNSALEFLTNRNSQENRLKEKEQQLEEKRLEIEERKIKIEEKRMNHEIDINTKRLELEAIKVKMEQANQKNIHVMLDNYHRTLDLLLKKINN